MGIVKVLVGAAVVLMLASVAVTILQRLSDEAVMTIVGVMCGIVASIPVSIILLMLLTRERTEYVETGHVATKIAPPAPQPMPRYSVNPVIVVTPVPPPQLPPPQVKYIDSGIGNERRDGM